jgi:3-phenylpropionate/cinnamic acid dioxygenase small subunit
MAGDVKNAAPDRARLRELRWAIEEFNYEYAATLDRGDVDGWTEYFTDDAVYRVTARDNDDAGLPLSLMSCEGRGMLKDRAYAILHTEMYAPRYVQHIVGNTRVLAIDGPLVTAESSYVILETLTDEPTRILQSGRYKDRFYCDGDRLLLKERQCVYDTVLVPNCLVYPA